jgi:hypothetical protein
MDPFHPTSVAVIDVVPVKVAFQPPAPVWPAGTGNRLDDTVPDQRRLVAERVVTGAVRTPSGAPLPETF